MLAVIGLLWQGMRQIVVSAAYGVAVDRMKSIINGWLVQVMHVTETRKPRRQKTHSSFTTDNLTTRHQIAPGLFLITV